MVLVAEGINRTCLGLVDPRVRRDALELELTKAALTRTLRSLLDGVW